ncbi:hypothetical protein Hypma_006968 [Hypsizygus marmoreus]|uniref:Uncharacterized protein n=1 Tax=Hypsizygus marmoreus TaxID=39966 RepID=A0A369JWR5_HYPMA|nr:hypothetical protein Hypma_006968 [Hypsizygus marmoreus]
MPSCILTVGGLVPVWVSQILSESVGAEHDGEMAGASGSGVYHGNGSRHDLANMSGIGTWNGNVREGREQRASLESEDEDVDSLTSAEDVLAGLEAPVPPVIKNLEKVYVLPQTISENTSSAPYTGKSTIPEREGSNADSSSANQENTRAARGCHV